MTDEGDDTLGGEVDGDRHVVHHRVVAPTGVVDHGERGRHGAEPEADGEVVGAGPQVGAVPLGDPEDGVRVGMPQQPQAPLLGQRGVDGTPVPGEGDGVRREGPAVSATCPTRSARPPASSTTGPSRAKART